MSDQENGLALLMQEMKYEEIHVKVNAVHRLATVIHSLDNNVTDTLIPYIESLLESEDDEVLFAVAEELGKCFMLVNDKTVFLSLLEVLASHDETVVREESTKSLVKICQNLSESDIQNVFAPLVIKLSQGEWFTKRVSSVALFAVCYKKSGPQKEKLRKKFIELCNEDTPMIRRACASKLGEFATQLDKQHVLQEILPIFRQLSQDEQDTIRVMCLESLIPMAKKLEKEENQIHTLGTLLAAGEDKSWKVRLSFAKNFAKFADSFGKEITDNNLINTFNLLLNDGEAEVKLAAINNISDCIKNISTEKINVMLLPNLSQNYADSTSQFKAGAALAFCAMSEEIGKQATIDKIFPIFQDLLKEENSEVKLNVVNGITKIAKVVGHDGKENLLTSNLFKDIVKLTKEGQWRLRMAVFEQLAELALIYGKDAFTQHIQVHFMSYLTQNAASVRNTGVEKSAILAKEFGEQWIINNYLPHVDEQYQVDKKGYNYRMCCLSSFAAVMPFIHKEHVSKAIIPMFVKATKDEIPNVKFCVSKLIAENRQHIDGNVYQNQLVGPLKEMSNDTDKDVAFFAKVALGPNA